MRGNRASQSLGDVVGPHRPWEWRGLRVHALARGSPNLRRGKAPQDSHSPAHTADRTPRVRHPDSDLGLQPTPSRTLHHPSRGHPPQVAPVGEKPGPPRCAHTQSDCEDRTGLARSCPGGWSPPRTEASVAVWLTGQRWARTAPAALRLPRERNGTLSGEEKPVTPCGLAQLGGGGLQGCAAHGALHPDRPLSARPPRTSLAARLCLQASARLRVVFAGRPCTGIYYAFQTF